MRRKWIRRTLWGSLIGVGLLATAVAVVPPLGREIQRRHLQATIARFEASPSQKDADELAQLLGGELVTPEQGGQILRMLLYPKVVTRSAYPLGTEPTFFTLERPFHVRLTRPSMSRHEALWIEGRQLYSETVGTSDFDTRPLFYRFRPSQRYAGLHRVEVRYKYDGTVRREKTAWQWNPLRGSLPWNLLPHRRKVLDTSVPPRHYTCQFSVPVELKLVEPDKAEKVGLFADEETDTRMRKAFTTWTPYTAGAPGIGSTTYSTPAGKRESRGGLIIKYDALPAAVSFRSILRLANGDRRDAPQARH